MSVGLCFQAEDGIRDLVRSRGLGDVYKRQGMCGRPFYVRLLVAFGQLVRLGLGLLEIQRAFVAVSYTHLTLPTSDLV